MTVRQVGDRRRHGGEAERPADRAVVAVQRGRPAAAGEVEVAAPVVVAVERGHAAADEEREVAVVAVVDPAGIGDEPGRAGAGGGDAPPPHPVAAPMTSAAVAAPAAIPRTSGLKHVGDRSRPRG